MAAAVVAPLSASAAQAAPPDRPRHSTVGESTPAGSEQAASWGQIIEAVGTAYSIYKKYSDDGGMTLEEATTQILGAIDGAKSEIIAHIDAVAVAEIRACAKTAVLNYADIGSMSPDTKQAFALSTTSCAVRAETLIGTVSDQAAIDQLGFAMNAVGPVALMARTHAGFSTAELAATLVDGSEATMERLATDCTFDWQVDDNPNHYYIVYITCTAYNGDKGHTTVWRRWVSGPEPTIPSQLYASAVEDALVNTSYELAKTARQVLLS
ncbi:hypothetical protein EBF04_00665 [Streptomyces sp. I6]|nr:hypothetical protein EBF04_00665 [Streptomyces sp. I6]